MDSVRYFEEKIKNLENLFNDLVNLTVLQTKKINELEKQINRGSFN